MQLEISAESVVPFAQDERGKTFELATFFESKNLLGTRKAGSVLGNHYHKGLVAPKNPETFLLLSGKIKFEGEHIPSGIKHQCEAVGPAVFTIPAYHWHTAFAETDVTFLEMNSLEEHKTDTFYEKPNCTISLIVAVAENDVIGNNNQMIWHLRDDMLFFKKVTTGNTVIMGRKTFESLGRPLPNRRNIVISRNPDFKFDGVEVVDGLQKAISLADGAVFIMGGAEIYLQAETLAEHFYITRIAATPLGDASYAFDTANKRLVTETHFRKNDRNEFDFTIQHWVKN